MKKRNIKYKTDYFLPKNNFWAGIGSVLNLAGCYFDYDYSKTEKETDGKALKSDWDNVGEDIEFARRKFAEKNKEKFCLK